MFIMLDGIDGSGKSTVLETWKDHLAESGNAIFDLKKYWTETGKFPELSEMRAYEFIFSCEPTTIGVGQVIRQELINKNRAYPPLAIAQAYSLDRLILYQRLIIPLLQDNKCVIQDRGISSSLAYQSLQDHGLTVPILSELPGNKLALEYRPDHLIIQSVEPAAVMARLDNRLEKQDDVIFEKLDFQTKLAAVYQSDNFQSIFQQLGTQVHTLNANVNIDIMKKEANKLLTNILKKPYEQ